MTRYVVAPNGVPSPLLTHMMNKRIEEERKAPCARHCEAKAFEIELRQKDARITELEAQNAKLKGVLKLIATAENSALDLAYCKGIARARAKLEGFTFHDSRHTAATRMAAKPGIDVLTLCKIFGWSNTKQALAYFNPKPSDLAKLLD